MTIYIGVSFIYIDFQDTYLRFNKRVENNTDSLINETLVDLTGAMSIAYSLIGNQIITVQRGGMFYIKVF